MKDEMDKITPEQREILNKALLEQRHKRNEETISKGLKTFVEVGNALAEIRDSKSYKDVAGYDTFEAYCKDKWEMSKPYAYFQITAAEVVGNLSTIVDVLPSAESQARPLTKLKTPEQQQEAWKRVLEVATKNHNGKVTAKLVEKVVDEFTAPAPEFDGSDEGVEESKGKRPSQDPPTIKEYGNSSIEKEVAQEALKILKRGLGKKYHPDAGGDDEHQRTANFLIELFNQFFLINPEMFANAR